MRKHPKPRHAKINFLNPESPPTEPDGYTGVTFVRDALGNIRAMVPEGGGGGDHTHTEDDLVLSDVTTNNVTTSRHGFTPKLSNDSSEYLDGTGNYSTPSVTGGAGGPGMSGVLDVDPPDFSDYSTFGSAPSGQVTAHEAGRFSTIQLGSNESSQTWYKAIPAAPYEILCAVSISGTAAGSQFVLDWLDNTPAVIRQMRLIVIGTTWQFRISSGVADLTTFNTGLNLQYTMPFYMRLLDDNTNWYFQFSTNGGLTWRTVRSETRNTGGTATQWGFRATSVTGDNSGSVIWTLYEA